MTRYALMLLLPFALACGGGDDANDSYSTAGDVSGIDSPSINRAGADCLLGSWEADVEQSFNLDAINEMVLEDAGIEMEFAGSTGHAFLTLGPSGSVRQHFEEFSVTVNADSPVGAMVVTVGMDGSATATYTTDADTLHFVPGDANLNSSTSVTLGGREFSNAVADFESLFETAERSMMTFSCTGDVLLLDVYESAEGGRVYFDDTRYVRVGGPA